MHQVCPRHAAKKNHKHYRNGNKRPTRPHADWQTQTFQNWIGILEIERQIRTIEVLMLFYQRLRLFYIIYHAVYFIEVPIINKHELAKILWLSWHWSAYQLTLAIFFTWCFVNIIKVYSSVSLLHIFIDNMCGQKKYTLHYPFYQVQVMHL